MTKDKYSFQEEAIKNIVSDFHQNNTARLLLVIPTGGGKTLTAIRSIDQMIKNSQIDEIYKFLWKTHRKALKTQTKRVIKNEKWIKKFNFSKNLKNFLKVEMVSKGIEIIKDDKMDRFKYVIIDECHHSSSKSYQTFFKKENLGILGLTATPTRLDRKELFLIKLHIK